MAIGEYLLFTSAEARIVLVVHQEISALMEAERLKDGFISKVVERKPATWVRLPISMPTYKVSWGSRGFCSSVFFKSRTPKRGRVLQDHF